MSLNLLREMLTYCRPAGSRHEALFRKQFLLPLPGAFTDGGGNIHVKVDSTPVLWSSHTDTVHNKSDRQHVILQNGWIELPNNSRSNCLGADDTIGCYLMRAMILARVPGYYVFHYGEERGGIGSSWLSRAYPEWLSTFHHAIALDRAGTGDIITHQFGGRTASDTFAVALAEALGEGWAPAHGVYTDTAEYADLISECTNLSVGYECQHSRHESVFVPHVFDLLSKLLTLDTTTLPAVRVPGDDDDDWHTAYSWRDYDGAFADDDNDDLCDTCDWMIRRGYTSIACPVCGRVIKADDDSDDYYDRLYLDPDYAAVQRNLLGKVS